MLATLFEDMMDKNREDCDCENRENERVEECAKVPPRASQGEKESFAIVVHDVLYTAYTMAPL